MSCELEFLGLEFDVNENLMYRPTIARSSHSRRTVVGQWSHTEWAIPSWAMWIRRLPTDPTAPIVHWTPPGFLQPHESSAHINWCDRAFFARWVLGFVTGIPWVSNPTPHPWWVQIHTVRINLSHQLKFLLLLKQIICLQMAALILKPAVYMCFHMPFRVSYDLLKDFSSLALT
jgi:hypothetical protein